MPENTSKTIINGVTVSLLGSVQVSGFEFTLEFTKMRFRLLGSVQVSGFEFTKMKFCLLR